MTYTIASFNDIFRLPTIEQMEKCVDELKRGLLQARLAESATLDVIEATTGKRPPAAFEFPESFEWTDDDKNEVKINFTHDGETLFSIATK